MRERLRKLLIAILSDENGRISSKRIIGVLAGLSIIAYSWFHPSIESAANVLYLALGALGITSLDKYITSNSKNGYDNTKNLNGQDK